MLFQPTNVIPSTFSGLSNSVIAQADNVSISWQVNGNSFMTGFKIKIKQNNAASTVVYTGSLVNISSSPFAPVDEKGNPQVYTYAPSGTTWASLGITDGNSYKLEITQYWTETTTNDSSVVQYSDSVFNARTAPTLTLSIDNGQSSITKVNATFTASYSQAQKDTINWVKWQLYSIDTNTLQTELLEDTGEINTSALSFFYDGFLPTGYNYKIVCSIETSSGALKSVNATYSVTYLSPQSGDNNIDLCTKRKDGSVLISFSKGISIPGTATGTVSVDTTNKVLNMSSGSSVDWDTVDDSAMSFSVPYSLGWKGKIPTTSSLINYTETENNSDTFPVYLQRDTDDKVIYTSNTYEINAYVTRIEMPSQGRWLINISVITEPELLISWNYTPQSSVNDPVLLTIRMTEPNVKVRYMVVWTHPSQTFSRTFSFPTRSITSFSVVGSPTASRGTISAFNSSYTANSYSYTGTVSVANAGQASAGVIAVTVASTMTYKNYYTIYPNQTYLTTNDITFSVIREANSTQGEPPYFYYLKIAFADSDVDFVSQSLPQYEQDISYLFFVNATNIYFVLFSGDNVLFSQALQNTATEQGITDITLYGEQTADWVCVYNGTKTLSDLEALNYQPEWEENTLFLASFSNDLQGGTTTVSSIYNAIYKLHNNKLKRVYNLSSALTQFKDYGICPNNTYSYRLYFVTSQSAYINEKNSAPITPCFSTFYLYETTQDSGDPNVFHILNVWKFGNNINGGTYSNNNTPQWQQNFTPYPLKQPSAQLYASGTLSALLSNAQGNVYADTAEQMQRLSNISASRNTFFLKDTKGNLFMVGIGAAITQTINTKTLVQEVSVSIPWKEVGDASDVSIISIPTDEGWTD